MITLQIGTISICHAGKFLAKRRHKEYALFTVLGLEKKHIARIVFMESLICMGIVAALSVIGGYVLGKFQFLLLNRAMHDISGTL